MATLWICLNNSHAYTNETAKKIGKFMSLGIVKLLATDFFLLFGVQMNVDRKFDFFLWRREISFRFNSFMSFLCRKLAKAVSASFGLQKVANKYEKMQRDLFLIFVLVWHRQRNSSTSTDKNLLIAFAPPQSPSLSFCDHLWLFSIWTTDKYLL